MKVPEKQALAVRCPTCGAKPGEKCELSTGLPRTDLIEIGVCSFAEVTLPHGEKLIVAHLTSAWGDPRRKPKWRSSTWAISGSRICAPMRRACRRGWREAGGTTGPKGLLRQRQRLQGGFITNQQSRSLGLNDLPLLQLGK